MSNSASSSASACEIDPLLKDLNEKKQSFRRNVVSLAAELKEVRSRLASQEHSFAKESLTRQACECGVSSVLGFFSVLCVCVYVCIEFEALMRSIICLFEPLFGWFVVFTGGRDKG